MISKNLAAFMHKNSNGCLVIEARLLTPENTGIETAEDLKRSDRIRYTLSDTSIFTITRKEINEYGKNFTIKWAEIR